MLLHDLKYRFVCIALIETWLLDVNADLFVIDSYKLLTHQRPTGNDGGVYLYVRNIYDVNILPIPMQCESFEHLQVTVSISHSTRVTFAVIYRPPHTPLSKLFV